MRTTVTLDADARLLVERAMRERGMSFKEAVNYAIRAGLGERAGTRAAFTTPRPLGPATIDLTKAIAIAAQSEDEAIIARIAEGR